MFRRKKTQQGVDLIKSISDQTLLEQIEKLKKEISRLEGVEREYTENKLNPIKESLESSRRVWCDEQERILPVDDIFIDDPIYRSVIIEKEIAPIFLHPLVQRLNYIRQLSFSYKSYPNATHSRLSHCLGVCKNAELTLSRIFARGVYFTVDGEKRFNLTDDEKRRYIQTAKIAALLHDLGHGPFGHGLDLFVGAIMDVSSPDKLFTPLYIANYLTDVIRACGFDPDLITKILDNTRRTELDSLNYLISSIIDSPLDVDRMDYLLRDAHITGLSIGNVNTQALIDRTIPFEGPMEDGSGMRMSLTYDESAVPYITHMLYAREIMYLQCYEHGSKVAAERMLMKAFQDFVERRGFEVEEVMLLTDDEMLRLLLSTTDKTSDSYNYALAILKNTRFLEVYSISPSRWVNWEDRNKQNGSEKIDYLEKETEERPPKPSLRVQEWEGSRLDFKERDVTRPTEWEKELTQIAGIELSERWKVIVTVPPPGNTEPKFADILILNKNDGKYYPSKMDISTAYWERVLRYFSEPRNSIRVFVAETFSRENTDKIVSAAKAYFED